MNVLVTPKRSGKLKGRANNSKGTSELYVCHLLAFYMSLRTGRNLIQYEETIKNRIGRTTEEIFSEGSFCGDLQAQDMSG